MIIYNDKFQHFAIPAAFMLIGLLCSLNLYILGGLLISFALGWECSQLERIWIVDGFKDAWKVFKQDSVYDLLCTLAGICLTSAIVYVFKGL